MQIKLPQMPFRFESPEGPMEITVRRGPNTADGEPSRHFAGAITFLQAGPRALERIQLSARADTYGGAMHALTEGFKVTANAHEKESVEYRVLNALCHAQGVVELHT